MSNNNSEVIVKTFLDHLEKCRYDKEGKVFNLPLFIRTSDEEINVDFAQTGWRVKLSDGGIPVLTKLQEDDFPSNLSNMTTINGIISEFYEIEKTSETSILNLPVLVNFTVGAPKDSTVYQLSNLFCKGGIRLGRGNVDLDIFGLPALSNNDIVIKKYNYYIIESISCKDQWTFGEVYVSNYTRVILTGSPKNLTNYQTKEDWLKGHPGFIEVTRFQDADILFTDSLKSTSAKMKRAKKIGLEIKEYIK